MNFILHSNHWVLKVARQVVFYGLLVALWKLLFWMKLWPQYLFPSPEQVLETLAAGLEDLYILGQPPEGLAVTAIPFMDNPLVVLAAPDHPLAHKKHISLARLAEEPWLLREPGSGTRKAVERIFAENGLSLTPRMELGNNEAIKQAVLTGLGISVLSRHTLALHDPAQFALLDVQGFPIIRQWYAVYPAGRQRTVVARTFLDFLLSHGTRNDAVKT